MTTVKSATPAPLRRRTPRHRAPRKPVVVPALRRAAIGAAVTAVAVTAPATAALAAPSSSLGSESLGSGSAGSSGSTGSLGSLGSAGSTGSIGERAGALPIPSPRGLVALGAAMTQVGKPYEWGAEGPNSYDCSGLVWWAYRQLGIDIGRTTFDQIHDGVPVPLNNIQPGDLIIFRENNTHIGIYAGFGQVWNAYDYGVPIGLTPLADEPPIHIVRRIY
ncbi:C40 family peptidase [Tomitella gaofuii]|uniref:C40 family peptidase n=1 Tax=Tomitella gaofuii TaxID=2760083 RepID=UPI0015FCD573|nr:C40 family peptidase [Tomitella gaofuii]